MKCIQELVLAASLLVSCGKWDKYYCNKMDNPPHPILEKTLSSFLSQGVAIDLGCGVGNESLLALQQGWTVYAIDSEPKAIKILQRRVSASEKLKAAVGNFEEESLWQALPCANLIYAAYSLPFCHREAFENVWNQIRSHLEPNGRFAGHFFGTHYQGFSEPEMASMTFLSKEELLKLFQDFEIEFFSEVEEDGRSGTGRPIHSHIFEVIAQKR